VPPERSRVGGGAGGPGRDALGGTRQRPRYCVAMTTNGVSIPPERARAAQAIAGILQPGGRVALTTHVNSDGDGVGSEVALWQLLSARGLRAGIANPTPIPERFDFLLPRGADRSDRAATEIESADVVVVL